MNQLVIFSILILLFLILSPKTKETLRISGSRDIRGDPYIPYNPFVSPWDVGTSLPIRNRRIIMESNNYAFDFGHPEYDYDQKIKEKV